MWSGAAGMSKASASPGDGDSHPELAPWSCDTSHGQVMLALNPQHFTEPFTRPPPYPAMKTAAGQKFPDSTFFSPRPDWKRRI